MYYDVTSTADTDLFRYPGWPLAIKQEVTVLVPTRALVLVKVPLRSRGIYNGAIAWNVSLRLRGAIATDSSFPTQSQANIPTIIDQDAGNIASIDEHYKSAHLHIIHTLTPSGELVKFRYEVYGWSATDAAGYTDVDGLIEVDPYGLGQRLSIDLQPI